ncbi:hypothetical protein AB0O91_20970 [Kitasatospora sp. NPDC089797]|uniref:hypothetical protein n=1 Tax=Kitasatospora sp. NPDC089797 TaxID=3155298 RepID=UPI0034211B18
MRFIGIVVAPDTPTLTGYLDQVAGAEYRAGRAGQAAPPQPGVPTVYGELWLISVNMPTTSGTNSWQVWAFTSNDDIPGWPASTAQYTGGIRAASDIAQPLKTAGNTVVLRHYSNFAVTSTAADVPLT